jgi:hypothetical protein
MNPVFTRWLLTLSFIGHIAYSAEYEWTFNDGTLASGGLSGGLMEYADAETPTLSEFGTSDGILVPHVSGSPVSYLHVPVLPNQSNGFSLTFDQTGPNGGGAYVNQYTIVMDLLLPSPVNWAALFNTETGNGNDADWYVSNMGAVGIGALGYSSTGAFSTDTWHRIAFAADLGSGSVKMFIDGLLVLNRTGGSLLDGRFSLYSNLDAGIDLLLFNEGATDANYTHELYVNSVYFTDRQMTDAELTGLGGVTAFGIVVPEPSGSLLLLLGAFGVLTQRRNRPC